MPSFQSRFAALDRFLVDNRAWWTPRPFHGDPLLWAQEHPEVERWLSERGQDWVLEWEGEAGLSPGAPQLLRDLQEQGTALTQLPVLKGEHVPLGRSWVRGMGGRKVAQVQAFVDASAGRLRGETLADWCAGKSHLGRNLGRLTGRPVVAYERDPALCAAAERWAEHQGVALKAQAVDVLTQQPALQADATLIALHACGELSDRAQDVATERGLPALLLAPCCHHKRASERYCLRSQGAQAVSGLGELDQNALRLSTAQEVVASKRDRRVRRNKMVYRWAYKQLHEGDFRAIPDSWALAEFPDFVQRMSGRLGHPAPSIPAGLLERGEAWMWRSRALGSVRAPFARVLELWITLDRAIWLQERGWQVEVGSFCEVGTSPRNLLIAATR